jgi:hypothetical protein
VWWCLLRASQVVLVVVVVVVGVSFRRRGVEALSAKVLVWSPALLL